MSSLDCKNRLFRPRSAGHVAPGELSHEKKRARQRSISGHFATRPGRWPSEPSGIGTGLALDHDGKRSLTNARNRKPFPQGCPVRRDVLPGSATQGPAPVGLGFYKPRDLFPVPRAHTSVRTSRHHPPQHPFPRSPPSPGGLVFFSGSHHRFGWRLSASLHDYSRGGLLRIEIRPCRLETTALRTSSHSCRSGVTTLLRRHRPRVMDWSHPLPQRGPTRRR